MREDHYVVIGNGPSGNHAAMTLKEQAPEAHVTIVSAEPQTGYSPMLLPDFIAGKITLDQLQTSSLESYMDKGVRLRNCQRVVDVDPVRKEIVLDHKEIVPFDGLIIAVGGRPRIPEPFLMFKDLLHTLKTLEDAKGWIEKLAGVETVLIIGGDLTSLAVTKALLHLDKEVYFMLTEEAFWPLRCTDELFEDVEKRLETGGVKILKDRTFRGMKHLSKCTVEVRLEGDTVEAGLIGAFFGLVPDTGFLARSGLSLDRGILVDETLNTGFEGVYATGDCAQVYHPEIRDYWVSIGCDNATALGRIAALNLMGERVEAGVAKESLYDVHGIKVNTSWWLEF